MKTEPTLGQVAHDAGAKAGGWTRKWDDMSDEQKREWETLARAVVVHLLKGLGVTVACTCGDADGKD